jgi:glycosyltransferase involved in cell wall biosynthesis
MKPDTSPGPTRLRILFCNFEYPPLGGGGGVVMSSLARALATRHEVTVLTSRALDLPAESVESNVRIVRVPVFFRKRLSVASLPSMLSYVPMGILHGMRWLGSAPFDIINTHFVVPSGPVGYVLSRLYGVPNVVSVHGGDLFDPSKKLSPHRYAVLRASVRWLLRRADLIIGQSQNTAHNVAGIYRVARDVELIPLGIDRPPMVASAVRGDYGLPEQAFLMVSVGRLVPRKSTVQLVRALAASQLPESHLLLVGNGPDAEAIRAAASEFGVSDRVHLLGRVSDTEKYRILQMADVFVSSSQHEGFGLVFVEAMVAGLPVVCFDHGGQTDFLATGRTGHVVPLNDLDAFTRAIVDLHASKDRREVMGRTNRELAREYFIDRCAERYEALFEQLLNRVHAERVERR